MTNWGHDGHFTDKYTHTHALWISANPPINQVQYNATSSLAKIMNQTQTNKRPFKRAHPKWNIIGCRTETFHLSSIAKFINQTLSPSRMAKQSTLDNTDWTDCSLIDDCCSKKQPSQMQFELKQRNPETWSL